MRYVLGIALVALSFVIFQAAAQQKHECEEKDGLAHKVDCLIRHVAILEKPQPTPTIKQSSIGCVKSGQSGLCAITDGTDTVTFFDTTGGVQGQKKLEGVTVPLSVTCYDVPADEEGRCVAVDAVGKKWRGSARGADWQPF